ncbi:hypothetical protein K2173_011749 [Erythroxylum novogranatense]|uniref:Uncharacterized protein n=1 Tax=Erythroxylum novogranatense TaxID=1862640 RepID=A0AAV8TJ60_9ROSI|nr:hypothetical protein K2173_011749 [Erythroxylum novogranatense]
MGTSSRPHFCLISIVIFPREYVAQLHLFIIHVVLDVVQDLAWTTSAIYVLFFRLFLKGIDRLNDMVVSVYILLNPLYLLGSRITSSHVDVGVM